MRSIYEGFIIQEYADRLRKAVTRYGLPKGTGVYHSWQRDLDYRVLNLLGYMQPSSPLYWQCYLYNALTAGGVSDREDIYTITILDQRWHFGEYKWDFAPEKNKIPGAACSEGAELLGNDRVPGVRQSAISRRMDGRGRFQCRSRVWPTYRAAYPRLALG